VKDAEAQKELEVRIKELKAFVKVFGDAQLDQLPVQAPVFHYSSVNEDASKVSAAISEKLHRGVRFLIGIGSGCFLVPGALLNRRVEDAEIPRRHGFFWAGDEGRFVESLSLLFRNFAVFSSAA